MSLSQGINDASLKNENEEKSRSPKICFVTVGATTTFSELVRAALDKEFLSALKGYGYSELRIQYGLDGKPIYDDNIKYLEKKNSVFEDRVKISGFDVKQNGLKDDFIAVRGELRGNPGCVICHAGKQFLLGVHEQILE